MARSRSRSTTRQSTSRAASANLRSPAEATTAPTALSSSAGASPHSRRTRDIGPPPRRPVTRSQSHELESRSVCGVTPGDTKSENDVAIEESENDVAIEENSERVENHRDTKGNGMAKRGIVCTGLEVVIEESPVRSSQQPVRSTKVHVNSNHGHDEDPCNISGTTILPSDSEQETSDHDYVMTVEVLQDLQHAATGVLDFLTPPSADASRVSKEAKRLHDHNSTQSRRLQRYLSNLQDEAKYFTKKNYINIEAVRDKLPRKEVGVGDKVWAPELILQQANCAKVAAEVLLAADAISARYVISDLESIFPSYFITVSESGIPAATSALHKTLFDLALDIRTQLVVLELADRQYEVNFNPEMIVKDMFFYNEELEEDDVSVSSQIGLLRLRGYGSGLYQTEDGLLPDEFEEIVYDRINDINALLRNEEQGDIDLEVLEAAYSWRSFANRLLCWIWGRADEITTSMKQQPSFDEVRHVLEHQGKLRRNLNREPSDELEVEDKSVDNQSTGLDDTESVGARPGSDERSDDAETLGHRPSKERAADITQPQPVEIQGRRPLSNLRRFLNTETVDRLSARWHAAHSRLNENHRKSDSAVFLSRRSGSPQSQTRSLPPQTPRQEASQAREIPESPESAGIFRSGDNKNAGWDTVDDTTQPVFETARASHSFEGITLVEPQEELYEDMNAAPASGSQVSKSELHPPSTEDLSRAGTQTALRRHAKSTHDEKASGTDRRHLAFIDRQANAHRVSPISERPSTEDFSQPAQPSRKGKRRLSVTSEYEEITSGDDEDFSQDRRNIDIDRRRRQKPDQSLHKRRRVREESMSEDEAAVQLQQEFDLAQEEPQDQSDSDCIVVVDPSTRRKDSSIPTSPSTASQRPSEWPPSLLERRQHIRWSADEEERLIYLIEKYGCSWAKIKEVDGNCPKDRGGPKLRDRSQIQIKDKARNVLLAHLRSGEKPHPNFKQVTLKVVERAKFEDQLIRWGWL